MMRLATPSKIRTSQMAVSKAKTVTAVIEVLRDYNVVLVLGKPDEASRKANRKFKIKAVR